MFYDGQNTCEKFIPIRGIDTFGGYFYTRTSHWSLLLLLGFELLVDYSYNKPGVFLFYQAAYRSICDIAFCVDEVLRVHTVAN